eukprot:12269873-Alexandrium_andersonii.AAC.1
MAPWARALRQSDFGAPSWRAKLLRKSIFAHGAAPVWGRLCGGPREPLWRGSTRARAGRIGH